MNLNKVQEFWDQNPALKNLINKYFDKQCKYLAQIEFGFFGDVPEEWTELMEEDYDGGEGIMMVAFSFLDVNKDSLDELPGPEFDGDYEKMMDSFTESTILDPESVDFEPFIPVL